MNEGTACIILKVEENRLHIRYKIKDEIGACMLSIGEWLTKTANMHADMLGEELDTGTNPRLDTTHSSFGPRPCRRPIDVRREACVEPTPIRQQPAHRVSSFAFRQGATHQLFVCQQRRNASLYLLFSCFILLLLFSPPAPISCFLSISPSSTTLLIAIIFSHSSKQRSLLASSPSTLKQIFTSDRRRHVTHVPSSNIHFISPDIIHSCLLYHRSGFNRCTGISSSS